MAINFQNYRFTNQIDTSPLAENTKRTSEGISNIARLGKQIFTSVRDSNNKKKFLDLVASSDSAILEKKQEKQEIETRIKELKDTLASKETELKGLSTVVEDSDNTIDTSINETTDTNIDPQGDMKNV